MPIRLCPWLGLKADPQVRHAAPSITHVCYAQEPPAGVELDHQARFCLSGEHASCPFYRAREVKAPPAYVRPGEAEVEELFGPPPPRFPVLRVLPWIVLALAAAGVVGFYAMGLLWPGISPTGTPTAVAATSSDLAAIGASATPSATPTFTPSPTPTLGPVAVATMPAFEFVAPTATPTPYPGGDIYSLSPAAGAAGWVASDEERGNHLGDSYLYSGLFDGVVYHGALQFDLSEVPRGATIHAATLELAGLDAERLGGAGVWEVRVLERETDEGWSRVTYQDVHNAAVQWTLLPALGTAGLEEGLTNVFVLSRQLLQSLEERLMEEHYTLSLRLDGPLTGENSLFAWDTGYGPGTEGRRPRLLLNVGPPPQTPIPTGSPAPTDTPQWVVVTSTPTPANAMTAAAIALQQTVQVTTTGLPTATPLYVATATPNYVYVTRTPTPANSATAAYLQGLATAEAILTGTPTPTPPNLATVEPVVLPWKPTPENAMTAAAMAVRETAQATTTGTATPPPPFAVTATPRYVVVTRTATPANAATAAYQSAMAAAHAVLTGTPTPAPPNLATATFTPLPTKTPVLVWLDRATPGPTSTFTPSPTPVPAIPKQLRGKIAFLSDRGSEASDEEDPEKRDPQVYLLDPGTGRLALLTDRWPYDKARAKEAYSPDGQFMVSVKAGIYGADEEGDAIQGYRVFVTELGTGYSYAITFSRISYDPVWSPRGDLIAYVSQEEEDNWTDPYGTGGDELYVITPQGDNKRRLTENVWEWDKHPSFSPDGSQIVYWSNEGSGLRQLWIVNADGSGRRVLMYSDYNDWDPVWIK